MREIADGLYYAEVSGDDGLDAFLTVGAAGEVALGAYVRGWLSGVPEETEHPEGGGISLGCSTVAVRDDGGEVLFGRNLDWERSPALILVNTPAAGSFSSVSTVDLEVMRYCGIDHPETMPEGDLARAALYFPLDGMNERGFAISVNMIRDAAAEAQHTAPGKTPLNFTAALRLLLDRAATVRDAVRLLGEYDLCIPGGGQLFHFAMADRSGESVAVEFIDGKTYVTETPAVTNFYLTPNEVSGTDKYGIGTNQSMERYKTLLSKLADAPHDRGGAPCLSAEGVRDALAAVAKSNFNVPGASTEWSVVFHLAAGTATYYRREDWSAPFTCRIPTPGKNRK